MLEHLTRKYTSYEGEVFFSEPYPGTDADNETQECIAQEDVINAAAPSPHYWQYTAERLDGGTLCESVSLPLKVHCNCFHLHCSCRCVGEAVSTCYMCTHPVAIYVTRTYIQLYKLNSTLNER